MNRNRYSTNSVWFEGTEELKGHVAYQRVKELKEQYDQCYKNLIKVMESDLRYLKRYGYDEDGDELARFLEARESEDFESVAETVCVLGEILSEAEISLEHLQTLLKIGTRRNRNGRIQ